MLFFSRTATNDVHLQASVMLQEFSYRHYFHILAYLHKFEQIILSDSRSETDKLAI